MKTIKNILLFAFFLLLLHSCGTKKDTFLSRNYQALTTKYNVLFNGKQALLEGEEQLHSDYNDDWFTQLPIEPIAFEEDKIAAPRFGNAPGANFGAKNQTEKQLTPFEIAEEKAVKAIQKHGMNINGLERNRQIDDAYLLLGKARYYQQRFVPAIEAFNYVIAKYPNANLIAETKIWRAKANIRNDNEERAIETMNLLLRIRDTLEAELPDKIKEQGYTALAMAYIKSDSIQKAKKSLQLATRTLENRTQGARNLFILGQLFAKEGKKDSATFLFHRLANFKKAPHNYKVRANIELAKNIPNDSSAFVVLEKLDKLIKERENRPFLGELYYQKAQLLENKDSLALATIFYNKSLRANNNSKKQKTFTYEKLANLSFNASNYLNASAYYDSVLQNSTDTLDLRIRRVKRKYKNLASLITYENTILQNDSILRIAKMSPKEQKQFFTTYVAKIKKADEEAAQQRLNQMAFANNGSGIISGTTNGNWYFYNSQSLNFGQAEFKRIWGNRQLQDNWRWSSSAEILSTNEENTVEQNVENDKYAVEKYLERIPQKASVLDSLAQERNNALFESGLLYKERFKNLILAEDRLRSALALNTDPNLDLPINWHLYQVYKSKKNTEKATYYKNAILNKYPETPFAKILANPEAELSNEESKTNKVADYYKKMYYLYKANAYQKVKKNIEDYVKKIPNSKLLPKFELLKALSIGKILPKASYVSALEFVSVTYRNTEEGKRAKQILNQLQKL